MCKVSSQQYLKETLSYQLNSLPEPSSELFQYLLSGLITEEDRENILTFTINLCSELKISTHTGLLACIYIDKFLNKRPTTQKKIFNLLAVVSLAIASKFKEGVSISPGEIQILLNGQYSIDAITTTERFFIETINWELSAVTICEAIDSLCEYYFDEGVDNRLANKFYSLAALCYCDSHLVMAGGMSIAVSSILSGIGRLGFLEVRNELAVSFERDLNLDLEKINLMSEYISKKLEDFSSQNI